MSLNDDDADTKSDIPVLYSDEEGKHPITWVKNNAAITGTLINVGRALRTQYPELHKLITTNTVEERGITYIDNPANIDFLEDAAIQAEDATYSFEKPCPPTAQRVSFVNDARVALSLREHGFLRRPG